MPLRREDQLAKYQAVDEEVLIIPKEKVEKVVPTIALSSTKVNKIIAREKKPPTEAQLEARKKFVEFNRERLAKKKEEEKKEEEEAKLKKKAEQQALLDAGTHVKVVIKPHGNTGRKRLVKSGSRVKKEEPTTTESETTDVTETDVTETDVTDTDTDIEEYKHKARKARMQAKKVVRTIKKIDQVLQQAPPVVPQNPYTALLASRWK